MHIDVILTAQACSAQHVEGRSAAVIDVLRATSVITTALANGAREVIACAEVEEARSLKAKEPTALLGGERGSLRIPGFDAGNSPAEYGREAVEGRPVILTTTNGTLAIGRAANAAALYVMSLLNVSAVADKLIADGRDVALVCAGTGGRFSLEDGICAAVCMEKMLLRKEATLSDGAEVLLGYYRDRAANIEAVLYGTTHAGRLKANGFEADLGLCFARDTLSCVPVYDAGRIHI